MTWQKPVDPVANYSARVGGAAITYLIFYATIASGDSVDNAAFYFRYSYITKNAVQHCSVHARLLASRSRPLK